MTKTLEANDLAQFTGSENWYQHGLDPKVLFTEGLNMSRTGQGLIGCSTLSL